MSRAFIAIISIVFVIGVGIWGLQAAVADAGTDHDIDGESWTPNAGNVTTLDHSNLNHTYYDAAVTVYDSNNNKVNPGEDYVWFDHNGTVKAVSGGALDGETSATIDYSYQTTTSDERSLIRMVGHIPQVLGGLIPLFGVALLFMILKS